MGLLIVFLSTLERGRRIFHEEFGAILPLKPGLSGRGDFGILLLIPLDRVLEWDYFRKCERAKLTFDSPCSGILNCDVN